jgi:hypothetical protein
VSQEAFLVQLSPDGTYNWLKNIRSMPEFPMDLVDVVGTPSGRHFVTGEFTGTELWLQGGGNVGGFTRDGFFLGMYGPTGNSEWLTNFPDNSVDAFAKSMVATDSVVVVSGRYTAPSLDFGNSAVTSSTAPNKQFFVWYNHIGQPIGAGTLDASVGLTVLDIDIDDQERVWAVCLAKGAVTWNGTMLGDTIDGLTNYVVVRVARNAEAIITPIVTAEAPSMHSVVYQREAKMSNFLSVEVIFLT